MSTRATYKFIGEYANTTYYIHYDGYPEGAAAYFRNMLTCDNKRGGLVTQFLRANDLAEITGDHSTHGDTEYAYTVDSKGRLESFEVKHDWKNDTETFTKFWEGDILEFVNKYAGEEPQLYKMGGCVYTEDDAQKALVKRVSEMWMMKGRGHTGNASSAMSDIIRCIKQVRAFLPTFGRHEETACREAARDFGKAYGWEKPELFETRFIDDELKAA